MTVTTTAWGVLCERPRKPFIYSETYRTRKAARKNFVSWWRDPKTAERELRKKRYRIVKVRIEVIE